MSVIRKELEDTRYTDLKDKFKELGIPEVFKPGIKKVDLVDSAVELLEKKETLKQDVSVADIVIEVEKDKVIANEVKEDKLSHEVSKIVANKEHWTKESIEKRITILNNSFIQHRGSAKGVDALRRREILIEAAKIMF